MKGFVYVVCGDAEYVKTLNFSLKFLKYFSKFPIWVITDSKRNEIAIEHDNIIDIDTPKNLNNHQASIYLKTSIHKYLDFSDNSMYCYIDSDVVAIDEKINEIFQAFASPITFAKDHCLIHEFSPYSINCNCLSDQLRKNNKFAEVNLFFKKLFGERYNESCIDKIILEEEFKKLNQLHFKNLFPIIIYLFKRYVIPRKSFRFKDYYFDKRNFYWYNKMNEIFQFDYQYFKKPLKQSTGIYFDKKKSVWKDDVGEIISPQIPSCNHLIEYISSEYNIDVHRNWQHWNGGVFLFDNESKLFLDYWHKITMEEFNNPYTKTRDQSTLAISVWKFGLQNHLTLCDKFNFIVEFNNPMISYQNKLGFTKDGFKTVFNPNFLHIYHEWGHNGWAIWDFVTELGKKQNIIKP